MRHVDFKYNNHILDSVIIQKEWNSMNTQSLHESNDPIIYTFEYLNDNTIIMRCKKNNHVNSSNNKIMCCFKHDGKHIIQLNDSGSFKDESSHFYHYTNDLLTTIDMNVGDAYDIIDITHSFTRLSSSIIQHEFTVHSGTTTCEHIYHNDDVIKTDLCIYDGYNNPVHTCKNNYMNIH
jgi:hypothetical protein